MIYWDKNSDRSQKMKIFLSIPMLIQYRASNVCQEPCETLGKMTKGQFFLREAHCLVGETDNRKMWLQCHLACLGTDRCTGFPRVQMTSLLTLREGFGRRC